jgi:hypothetical protein
MPPQLPSYLLGRPLPPQPGELGVSHVPSMETAVETGARDQGSEACRITSATRYHAMCAVHGRFGIDEYQQAPLCPLKGRS